MRFLFLIMFLIPNLGLGNTPYSYAEICGFDTTRFGQPVRVVREYNPNLPQWFRLYNDPVLPSLSLETVNLQYNVDPGRIKTSVDTPSSVVNYGVYSQSLRPLRTSEFVFLANGGLSTQAGGSGLLRLPFRLFRQPAFIQSMLRSSYGQIRSNFIPDSVRNLLAIQPLLGLEWNPFGYGKGDLSLDFGGRLNRFNRNLNNSGYTTQWIMPRWSRVRNSQGSEGFYSDFDLRLPWFRQARFLQEQGLNFKQTLGYQFEKHGIQFTIAGDFSRLIPDISTINIPFGNRQWISGSPNWNWKGKHSSFEVGGEFGFLKDTLHSKWIVLPQLVYRHSSPGRRQLFLKNLNWEIGLTGSVLPPSFMNWGRTYSTILAMDHYSASVKAWEAYFKLDRSGPGQSKWKHTASMSEWRNPRFFFPDSIGPMAVMTRVVKDCYRVRYESRFQLGEQENQGFDFYWGGMALFRDRTLEPIPGLQPAAFAGIHYRKQASASMLILIKVDFMASALRPDSKTPRVYPQAWNTDIEIKKRISSNLSWFAAYRLRQTPLVFRWSEDLFWGQQLHLGLVLRKSS